MRKHSSVIEVLGCSGSIGIPRQGTTSFLIDDDILIDAGTGLCELTFERLEKIDHLVITHSHLDHICALPFLVDTVGVQRKCPLTVYATRFTLDALRAHIFNNTIWPDFTKIPNADNPVLEYVEIAENGSIDFGSQRRIQTVAVEHSVPTIGVVLHTPTGAWCFSGDTHQTEQLYDLINQVDNMKFFFIEAAFPDKEKWLANLAKHLCPSLLFAELDKLKTPCEVWISHLKPREYEQICQELKQYSGAQALQILSAGMVFKV